MDRILFTGVFLTMISIGSLSYAQDAEETAEQPAPSAAAELIAEVTPPAPVVSIPSSPKEDPTQKILREGVPLRVRQEQGFDANSNNRLDPNEVREFFKSVYADTANGPVKNTSDVLYHFDRNQDGFIDRSEASSMPR